MRYYLRNSEEKDKKDITQLGLEKKKETGSFPDQINSLTEESEELPFICICSLQGRDIPSFPRGKKKRCRNLTSSHKWDLGVNYLIACAPPLQIPLCDLKIDMIYRINSVILFMKAKG